jgi:hypothetical protein
MVPTPPDFSDVQTLLDNSWPKPRAGWFVFIAAAMILGLLSVSMASDRSPGLQGAAAMASMVLLVGGMSTTNYLQVRRRRVEQSRLEMAQELVQLKHWPQAAQLLQTVLSRPTTNPVARLQALVYFSDVLSRFERYEDITLIADHVLETIPLDAPAVHQVKLARATALLRQDRLFDADRAISDLRHSPQAAESAGLALLEMYRDVKTGHPTEALETYGAKLELIRRQLGHRVAEAYVLAAAANHLLNNPEPAQADYARATIMAPATDLHRRYPETAVLAASYPPVLAPPEIAQGAA